MKAVQRRWDMSGICRTTLAAKNTGLENVWQAKARHGKRVWHVQGTAGAVRDCSLNL